MAFLKVCHQDLFHEAYNCIISLKIQKHDPHQEPFKHSRLSHPKKDNLPLRHTAHPTTPWSPTLTPHRDAFLHHLWGGVAQYSVWEIGPDKRKWGIRGEGGRTLLTYPGYSRPAHFLSRVAGSGDVVHRPDYTPNHQHSQLGTLPRRIMGVSMTNGTRHDPCIPRHWAMRCPVVNKIRPNTDVASISSVLHLVWPLAQSLSSMVVPTRRQNSSWHSLWDLRGTQAPQLQQSNNTLGGALVRCWNFFGGPSVGSKDRDLCHVHIHPTWFEPTSECGNWPVVSYLYSGHLPVGLYLGRGSLLLVGPLFHFRQCHSGLVPSRSEHMCPCHSMTRAGSWYGK